MFQIGSVFPNCRRDATDSSSSRRSLVQTFLELGHRRLLHPLLCATAYPANWYCRGPSDNRSSRIVFITCRVQRRWVEALLEAQKWPTCRLHVERLANPDVAMPARHRALKT